MKSLSKRFTLGYGPILAVCSLLVAIFGVAMASRVQAVSTVPTAGERLITVHDRGQDRGILTRASTLREAFKAADINIDPNDTVEPGLDEQLVANNYEVNIYRARPVTIIDGAVREKVMSPYRTAKQIADQANITLQDEDIATISAGNNMVSEGAGVQMTITRATPFTFVLYGTKMIAYTQEKTVGDMLKKKNVILKANDTLSVPQTTAITAGMTIELWREGKQTATEEQEVPFETEKIKDADREVGFREVKTPGVNGKRTVTYEIEMKNGQQVSRTEIQSVVTQEPKKQIEIVGAKATNTFNGSFAEALARLRSCEGSYTSNTGNGYYGAYQFDRQTWGGYGGFAVASDAPPAVQDEKAWQTYQRRGWQPWPSCRVKMGLQDIYR